MDLRKSVLLNTQKVLSESSFNTSAYDSANEDGDKTIYYSFSSDSAHDESGVSEISNKENQKMIQLDDRKSMLDGKKTPIVEVFVEEKLEESTNLAEKTKTDEKLEDQVEVEVIETPMEVIQTIEPSPEVMEENLIEKKTEQIVEPEAKMVVQVPEPDLLRVESPPRSNSTNESSATSPTSALATVPGITLPPIPVPAQDVFQVSALNPTTTTIPEIEVSTTLSAETQLSGAISAEISSAAKTLTRIPMALSLPDFQVSISPMILVHDPNENVVNPFTAVLEAQNPNNPAQPSRPTGAIRKQPSRSTKIPSSTKFYSPVLRKSLEKNPRAIAKPPQAARRTIFKVAEVPKAAPPKRSRSPSRRTIFKAAEAPKAAPPKRSRSPAVDPPAKSKTFRCSIAACSSQVFATLKAYQDHQKTHRAISKPSTTFFPCIWCLKNFQLETALMNHHTENCQRIPFNKKKKILEQRDKKDSARRRTTLFSAPVPKRKSPRRRPPTDNLSKSGIKITPKKSLKCHACGHIVADAVSLAEHIMAHNFARENPSQ